MSALKLINADLNHFDVVVSDVMPGPMDGVGLLRELRQRMPALSVILTTGYSHVLAQGSDESFG